MDSGSLPSIAPTHVVAQRAMATVERRTVVEPVLQGELLQREPSMVEPQGARGQTYRFETASRHAQPGFRGRYDNEVATGRRAVAAYQAAGRADVPTRGRRLDVFI